MFAICVCNCFFFLGSSLCMNRTRPFKPGIHDVCAIFRVVVSISLCGSIVNLSNYSIPISCHLLFFVAHDIIDVLSRVRSPHATY